MKLVMLIGNHPRHYHIAKRAEKAGFLAGLVVEEREAYIPVPPPGIDPHLKQLFSRHFADRARIENEWFGESAAHPPAVPTLHILLEELNSEKVWSFVRGLKPDLAISYGVHKLTDETLSYLPENRWNTHGGLSPWYRGCITHFWPSYMLEPNKTGVTLHGLTAQIDAGPVVHQNAAPMVRGDGIHDLACRAVHGFGEELPRVLEIHKGGELRRFEPQKTSGRLWLSRDWRPEHLRLIYDTFENRIVDAVLDGIITPSECRLTRQF